MPKSGGVVKRFEIVVPPEVTATRENESSTQRSNRLAQWKSDAARAARLVDEDQRTDNEKLLVNWIDHHNARKRKSSTAYRANIKATAKEGRKLPEEDRTDAHHYAIKVQDRKRHQKHERFDIEVPSEIREATYDSASKKGRRIEQWKFDATRAAKLVDEDQRTDNEKTLVEYYEHMAANRRAAHKKRTDNYKQLEKEALLLPEDELTDGHQLALDRAELLKARQIDYEMRRLLPPDVLNKQHATFLQLISDLNVPENQFVERVNIAKGPDIVARTAALVDRINSYQSLLRTIPYKENVAANSARELFH
ncbi:hypothetical protein M3Y98_00104300 [Aphelenchoides besseyi]|nr:hypothetical protein M3Y98_00104300 [Aphelenchoides besseyi]